MKHSEILNRLAQKIIELRTSKNISQEELIEASGVKKLPQIEAGEYEEVSMYELIDLADALGVDVRILLVIGEEGGGDNSEK